MSIKLNILTKTINFNSVFKTASKPHVDVCSECEWLSTRLKYPILNGNEQSE